MGAKGTGIRDDHIFRAILNGMQGALAVYVRAFKQSTFNDRIRDVFKSLLLQKIDYLIKLNEYGRSKGWFNPKPAFRPQKKAGSPRPELGICARRRAVIIFDIQISGVEQLQRSLFSAA